MRTALRLACLTALLLTATTVQAAEPLSAVMHMSSGRARTGAPIWIDLDLANNSASLIEGHLEMELGQGVAPLGRYAGWDMALANGTQRFRIMLPQPPAFGNQTLLNVHLAFVAQHGTYDMGWQPLSIPAVHERAGVVAVGSPNASSTGPPGLARSLQLERYETDRSPAPGRRLSTFPAALVPEDFPLTPLGYCAYDLVVLPPDDFPLVRQRQLDALAEWVRAGGSVCVLRGGTPLKPYQTDFLKDLSGGSSGEVVGMHHCGLGRAVIAEMPDSFESAGWRRAVAFLWRVRGKRVDEFVNQGTWRVATQSGAGGRAARPGPQMAPSYVDPGNLFRDTLGAQPLAAAANFYAPLMPKSIRLMPLGWIALLLVLFVLAIGPGDYVLLGLLKRRKLTWLLFPAVCIGASLCMTAMARHYMGANDQRAAFVFVDLGEGGRVLRTNRYELVYAAREFTSAVPYRDALASPVNPGDFVRASRPYYGPGYYDDPAAAESGPASYSGHVPAAYEMSRLTRQWTPQLTRVLSIGRKGTDMGLHWDAVTIDELRAARSGLKLANLVREFVAGSGLVGDVYVMNGRHSWEFGFAQGGRLVSTGERTGEYYAGPGTFHTTMATREFLRQTVARPDEGFFSVVSQVSPSGAGNFEDLSLLDSTDPDQWVVMAVQKAGDDFVICRRLYCGGQ